MDTASEFKGDEYGGFQFSIRDLRRNIARLSEASTSTEAREEALIRIGHIVYMGGKDVYKAATPYLHVIFGVLLNKKYNHPSTKLACLRCLSEICNGYQPIKTMVAENREVMDHLIELLNNYEGDKLAWRIARWTCYTLMMITNNEPKILSKLTDHKGLKEALEVVADSKKPWTGWGGNVAEHVLKMFYWRDPSEGLSAI